jgi:uncharacterized membrane protein
MMLMLIGLVKFVHVATAIAFVVGLVGREVARLLARRSREISGLVRWIEISGWFERRLVIPGSMLVLGAGLALAALQGWPILGFLQGARTNWVLASLVLYLLPIPIIVRVFLPRGKIFEQRLASAVAEGRVTGGLVASFDDRAVRAGHLFEAVAVGLVMYLMIAKPF